MIYCIMIVMLSGLSNKRTCKVSYLSDTSWREDMHDNGNSTRSSTGLTRVNSEEALLKAGNSTDLQRAETLDSLSLKSRFKS